VNRVVTIKAFSLKTLEGGFHAWKMFGQLIFHDHMHGCMC